MNKISVQRYYFFMDYHSLFCISLVFFRNFAHKLANLLRLGKKKELILLFCSRLFVSLHPKNRNKMKRLGIFALIGIAWAIEAQAQLEIRTEAQLTATDGDHTPLWLNANKYGLSSLDNVNGYVRAGIFRDYRQDSCRQWKLGYGADLALAGGFTSTLVVQQAYGEVGWLKGLLTIGSKEHPMELKNQELSTGSQTLGINARPVPAIRLSLPDYWTVPGTKGWLGLKGHISYGMTTDDGWQRDFTRKQSKYAENTLLHTKAGYLKIGPDGKPISLELGLEMACQFGGTSYTYTGEKIENTGGLKGALRAFIPGGNDVTDEDYKNADGNHLGSVTGRLNFDYPSWGLALWFDHFFEDHSQMVFLDRNDYGTGDDWDKHVGTSFFVYDLRDALLGVELRLKKNLWLGCIVAEYIYTKYQSGPVYHDHTKTLSDKVAGVDKYYNHHIFPGWQHWGQVMGNPLYRSPLYNDDGLVMVEDNRFQAWHLAASGDPLPRLHYRLMCTWQRGFGTYDKPLPDPQRNLSLLAEAAYRFADDSWLGGWSLKGAIGMDKGGLLGDNVGVQLTVAKRIVTKKGKQR